MWQLVSRRLANFLMNIPESSSMATMTYALLPLMLCLADARPAAAAPPAQPSPTAFAFAEARSLFESHCLKCHGEKSQKGGVNLAPFTSEKALVKQRKLWRAVAAQIASGDMPPEDQKQLTKVEREQLLKWLNATLDAADEHARKQPDPGPSIARRLTRREYNRTIRDLLGIEADIASDVGLPDETVGESFDNLAAALNFSDTLMEKYFAAADAIIERLYAPKTKGAKLQPGEWPPLLGKLVVRPEGGVTPKEAAKKTIESLVRRAYRRELEAKERDRYLALHDKALEMGMSPVDAFKPVLRAVLVSPHFLLRVERDRAKDPSTPYRVSDHELATRLSYFLWSTMPDEELLALAAKGELSRPEILEQQVRRMLASPKAKALTEIFAEQWLMLDKLQHARPSTEFFPTFNNKVRQAMHQEVSIFFDKLREEDHSILDLLDARYTYLNADLAAHYGIPDVKGPEMRKVAITDPNRGGLVGMGAVLAITSHSNRTSPTLRGKYVLSVILGTPPPPPPPGAGQIDEGKVGKVAKNFREKLALHATQANCAGCHARIDPLGFGLENFDAVGRFRPSGGDVDATGKLPTGEKFDGPGELKRLLLERKDRFAMNMIEKMLVYALGRELQASDGVFVEKIAADSKKDGYRFSTLVLGIVNSYSFQHRLNFRE
jgi:mono/diheme cytochrome c family protein